MPIPDKEKLRAELKETGEKEVREKLSQGVYGSWKVETIKNWLREKEEERASVTVGEAKTHAKQNLTWTKIGVIAAIVSALVAFAALWFSK